MKNNGFTMIEVMVALAIVGISLGVFISILGNSLRIRWKLEDHARDLIVARVAADKMRLGLVDDFESSGTEDSTNVEIVPIEVTVRSGESDSESMSGGQSNVGQLVFDDEKTSNLINFYKIIVGGIELSTSLKGAKKEF